MGLKTDLRRLAHAPDALNQLRRTAWWVRNTFFTRPKPDAPGLVVDLPPERVEALLGRRYFEPGWEMSYSYRGEVLNLRRVQYETIEGHESVRWWQVHVRGYERGNRVELTAHFEPEPTEHPGAHISRDRIDVRRGMRALRGVLDAADVEYARIPSPNANGAVAGASAPRRS